MEGDWLHATLNIDKDVMRTWDWVDDPRMIGEDCCEWLLKRGLTNDDEYDIIIREVVK